MRTDGVPVPLRKRQLAAPVFIAAPVGGPVADAHLVQHHSQTPYVHRSVYVHAVSNLGSEVVEGAGLERHEGLVRSRVERQGQAEVGKLEMDLRVRRLCVLACEDVRELEIAVDHTRGVNVCQGLDDLSGISG